MSKFDKIIGYSAVKKELKQIADTLKNREVYAKLGVSSPRGLLLYGEPGVGKSLKSEQEQAVAAEVEKFYRKAKEIISLNFEFFEKIAAAIAKKKLLSAVDIQKIKSACKIVPVAL